MLKLISLIRFYIDCTLAYFKPGARWNVTTFFYLITRLAYYFCNWCYCFFLYTSESLVFGRKRELNRVDRTLYRHYLYPSQFWLALTEGLKVERPETLYRLTYGETSWFGIRAALKAVNANANDVFYDLGCGTGRNVFYANVALGLRSVGVDLIHSFVDYANQVVDECALENIQFLEQDIFVTNLSEATIIYVTANCYDQETMLQLVQRLNDLPQGARVISTHRTIPSPRLQLEGSQRLPFSWGVDKVYYQTVI